MEACQRLETVLDWHAKQEAKKRETSGEAQAEIYRIQKRKQRIMRDLKFKLQELDNPEVKTKVKKNQRLVTAHGDQLQWLGESGIVPVTVGELLTDGDWGIEYAFDGESVPRMIRKQYLIADAKRKLQDLLDEQISVEAIASARTHEFTRGAYQRSKEEKDAGIEHEGILAEKMVQNFLTQLSVDYNLDFRIESADVYQDIQQKIDFMIHRTSHTRGVGVEADDQGEDIGVQFTISQRPESLEKKQEQISRSKQLLRRYEDIDDLVLISIPIRGIKQLIKEWEGEGKPPGGPSAMWYPKSKEKIFKLVLEKMYSREEIEEMWNKVARKHVKTKEKKGV